MVTPPCPASVEEPWEQSRCGHRAAVAAGSWLSSAGGPGNTLLCAAAARTAGPVAHTSCVLEVLVQSLPLPSSPQRRGF